MSRAPDADGWVSLCDTQWMNIVNHDHAYESMSKDDAVNHAVRMTEAKLREINVAAHVPPAQAPVDERAAFEAHIRALNPSAFFIDRWPNDGDYKSHTTSGWWKGWQARASLAAPVGQPAAPVADLTGKELYLARYEHEGAVWAANEHQDVWNDWADRLNARAKARSSQS